jgi:excinuclease UvrABC ATPase subunit
MTYGVRESGNRWSKATYGSIEVGVPRENDLRDASLDIPQRQLSVATGVSGQGTSSTG